MTKARAKPRPKRPAKKTLESVARWMVECLGPKEAIWLEHRVSLSRDRYCGESVSTRYEAWTRPSEGTEILRCGGYSLDELCRAFERDLLPALDRLREPKPNGHLPPPERRRLTYDPTAK